MKKLPIGIQTFRKIIEENCTYVDKTGIAYNLINNGSYYFLSRPRRFGKSLFLDTLAEIFKGSKELFEGLEIYDKWDWEETYPVIKIDFGKGDYKDEDDMYETILKKIEDNGARLGVDTHYTQILSIAFSELIENIYQKYHQKVVILIDEYDKPIIDNITNDEVGGKARDILANFYSAIKSSDEFLKFVFMTGVSKFSKMNLFSALNNITDITLQKKYATITGYTHNDLTEVFKEHLKGVDLEKVRKWYNGYNYLGEPVYNPFDILQFIDNECTYKNYWWETGNPRFLIETFKKQYFHIPELENITVSSEILNHFEVNDIDLVALLWQTGYLTFDKEVEIMDETFYKMKVPNLEIQKSLNSLFATLFVNTPIDRDKNQVGMYTSIMNQDYAALENSLRSLFASIPHNNYTKNDIAKYEGFYASVVYTFLRSLGFDTVAEDITNKGRIDLTLKTPKDIIIFEFKVDSKDTALHQIKEKRYYEKYLDDERDVVLVGVNFSTKEKNITDYVWEKIS